MGESGLSDTPIMSFQLQQNAIIPHLTRTIQLNIGYNEAKNLFANPTGREHEQIKTYCVIKCFMSWNVEKVSNTCRERLGGGSFLASSAIPEGIAGAHSGMTAEGDNRVLMQKVVKDILSDMQKKQHRMPTLTQCPMKQIPAMKSIANLETLTNLIYFREVAEIKNMTNLLKDKIMEQGKNFFDVW